MRNLIPLLLFFLLASACTDLGDCGADNPKAQHARSLSQAQLQAIYDDAHSIVEAKYGERGCCGSINSNELPPEWEHLGIVVVSVHPFKVYLRMEGCMDHHLDLVIISGDDDTSRIELWSGEGPERRKEILWTASAA